MPKRSAILEAITEVLVELNIPWRIAPRGRSKHDKIVFIVNGKECWHTVSRSPSDIRAPLNAVALVRRKIREAHVGR